MMISNLCSALTDVCCVFAVIFSLCALIVGIVVLNKLKDTNNSVTDTNNDYEKIKILFESEQMLLKQSYEMIAHNISKNGEQLSVSLNENLRNQQSVIQNVETRIKQLLDSNENKLNNIDQNLKQSILALQNDNAKKLDQMRETVDEKLNVSLERRLNESFAIISDRLEKVNRGLGEMQELATGVGDLKKVLSNVKTRGVWGEITLGNILEQMLAPNQFAKEYATKENTTERVDYVVFLPGKDGEQIYLPIDAKFPIEDYTRLVDASERANVAEIEKAQSALFRRIKDEAKKIRDKYVNPPKTTDFAVLYLALEGLYAEVMKNADLVQQLQRDFRIVVCGPTTLTALINSLQMGFKTVAIEKRSSEIWTLLATFKKEFVKFAELLMKTQKKIDEASSTIEDATKKTKTIQGKLKSIGIADENVDKIENSSNDEN